VYFCQHAIAQEKTEPPPDAPSATQSHEELNKKEQSQRILGIVPEFSVSDQKDAKPMTPRQKFVLFARSAFDPFVFGAVAIQAGISQAQDSFSDYGQGASGYGKRYGAALADQVSSGFFANFVYPVMFKEDPRYFRLGEGSGTHRVGYALSRVFVCRTDSGHKSFNFSSVLGAFTSGAISNAYYPESDRGVGLTMSRGAISLGYGGAGNMLNEFWPDIHRKFFEKDKNKGTPGGTAPKNP
jgi:hypothetical protein